jgi:hypothetical protein
MKRFYAKLSAIFCALIITISVAASAPDKAIIKDEKAKAMLVGEHRFSLQWVSWDYFGKAKIEERNGELFVKGEQRARKGDDSVTIDGRITQVNAKDFKFNGVIITKVSHMNNGAPCQREGEFTFRITGNRRFWRLKEMTNPCDSDGAVDYIDIYFR